MKVAYVSGKYRDARGPWYVKENIEKAERIAIELWKMGFAVICPHKNTAFFEGPLDDPVIIAGDCELVRRSDALIVVPGWKDSQGTRIEWDTAWNNSKPIFYWEKQWDRELLKQFNTSYDAAAHVEWQKQYRTPEQLLLHDR